jgi:hypothetical protein
MTGVKQIEDAVREHDDAAAALYVACELRSGFPGRCARVGGSHGRRWLK